MKNESKLQIKLLSNSGQLISSVSCFAGQVTVFRAQSDRDLLPYQRALAGVPGPERFSIQLDNANYNPAEQQLIGFGEKLPPELTVSTLMARHNVSGDNLVALLSSFGLDEYLETPCATLSECAARRIQILAATCSAAKVLVLCDPFEPISFQWRERIAEFILNDVSQHRRITLVPRLSYRPQCWIGNEAVARVQVGEAIQKTIGFAQAATQSGELIDQMRSLLKDDEAVKKLLESQGVKMPEGAAAAPSAAAPQGASAPPTQFGLSQAIDTRAGRADRSIGLSGEFGRPTMQKSSPRGRKVMIGAAGGVATALAVAVAVLFLRPQPQSEIIAIKLPPTKVEQSKVKTAEPLQQKKDTQVATNQATINVPPGLLEGKPSSKIEDGNKGQIQIAALSSNPTTVVEKPLPKEAKYVIEGYPKEVQLAVLRALRSPLNENSIKIEKAAPPKEQEFVEPAGFSELSTLKSEPGNSAESSYQPQHPVSGVPQMNPNDPDFAERQERIRQKFLEAINRAVEQRQGQE